MEQLKKSTKSSLFKFILWVAIFFTLIRLFEIQIINSPFIFFYHPFLVAIFYGLIILVIISLIYWIRNEEKVRFPFVPFFVSVFALAVFNLFPFTSLTLHIDFYLKESRREEIVEMIYSNKINYDSTRLNREKIEEKYADLSAGLPEVEVEKINGEIFILFYTFSGLTDNSAGFVYVPDEKVISQIKLGKFGQSRIFYNPIEITKFADHWYFVSNT